MDVDGGAGGAGGVGRELTLYVLWGGMLVQCGDGKVTYEGGVRKCMVVNEGVRLEELLRKVNDITGGGTSDRIMWYSLKYDREILVEIEGDNDIKMMFKGNDEHAYIYIGGKEPPVRRAEATLCGSGGGRRCAGSGRACGSAGNGGVGGKRLVDSDSGHSEDQPPERQLRMEGES